MICMMLDRNDGGVTIDTKEGDIRLKNGAKLNIHQNVKHGRKVYIESIITAIGVLNDK